MATRATSKKTKVVPTPEQTGVRTPEPAAEPSLFPVVGIGASAGGLEAFTTLLKCLPADTGMAFVLIQHMDPTHESSLGKILTRSTQMPVTEVVDGVTVEPNHVYVIPPNADIAISDGCLRLSKRLLVAGRHLPFDSFLLSLAQDRNKAAIGIVLSGTASDGTQGLIAIKAEGGITFAQDEKSARHSGMPMSAVAAGCVDFVLSPEEIASELIRISSHPYIQSSHAPDSLELAVEGTGFRKICLLLRSATGVDFLQYKPATISRRLARRMAMQKVESPDVYLQFLRKNPSEVHALYQDILIHVTSFFRDPDTIQALQDTIFPSLIAGKVRGSPLRLWIPGCSTGEEAYSIAIALVETLGDAFETTKIQIFGTDISDRAIQKARAGEYPEAGLANLAQEKIRKFFVKVDGGYQIAKQIREQCVFARHDLTRDPPFSNLDFISCRNVLIYLEKALQKRTIQSFHYALRPGGFLMLGKSESPAAQASLFTLEDRKHHVYSRRQVPTPQFDVIPDRRETASQVQHEGSGTMGSAFDLRKETERILLDRFAPPAIVVDPDLNIVHFHGDTSPYLAPASGEPSFHLLRILRPDLVVAVRAAIEKVKLSGEAAAGGPIHIVRGGLATLVRVDVLPLPGRPVKGYDFMVIFHEEPEPQRPKDAADGTPADSAAKSAGRNVTSLKRELASTQEYLRTLVAEHDCASEELKAANEEVLSANEELQSANEELETAKEELQSTNEELATLNEELQNRNTELILLANDLNNVLTGVDIPIVILDRHLRIRRFTPKAEKILNLIPSDAGRPFTHIASTLSVPSWDQLLSQALDQLRSVELEVQDNQGHWYALRLRPYRTSDHKIEGVLIVLLDIDPLKRTLDKVRDSRDFAEAVVETISEPLLVLDGKLCVLNANPRFFQVFRASAPETLGRSIFDLGDGQWNIPPLRQLLLQILPRDSRIEHFEVDHDFPAIGFRHMLLNACQLHRVGQNTGMILLAINDITEQAEARMAIEKSESRYRAIVHDQTELVCRFLPDGTLTFVNAAFCAYFDRTPNSLLGRSFLDALVAEPDRRSVREFLDSITPAEPVQIFERQMADPGSPWRQWVTHAFFDEQGRVVEFQSSGHDITQQKQNEAALLLYQKQLQGLTARLLATEEENHKRLARELHDVLSQKLAVLGMEISAIQHNHPVSGEALDRQLQHIGEQIGTLARDIHQVSRQLHPAILDDLGLTAALRNECLVFSEQYGIPVQFTDLNVGDRLPEAISLCLYRVAQESLRNIGKHSAASQVRVALHGDDGEVSLEIEDVGDGFDLENVRGKRGLGLVSMDERVRLVDGTFSIQSEPKKGTIVLVTVPLGSRQQ
jgi:two-component system CheB/CheR fusion protein